MSCSSRNLLKALESSIAWDRLQCFVSQHSLEASSCPRLLRQYEKRYQGFVLDGRRTVNFASGHPPRTQNQSFMVLDFVTDWKILKRLKGESPALRRPFLLLFARSSALSQEAQDEEELNIAPKKANWDLKRDVEKKLEKLNRRTQRAIVEIIRERMAEVRVCR